jgi:hypothetical protein
MDLDQDVVVLQCFWLVVFERAHNVWSIERESTRSQCDYIDGEDWNMNGVKGQRCGM